MKEKKPGILSPELVIALGTLENAPPPWLINMQRYGPPPSYPNLVIPGLNAPLPEGASFGYHPGGWGKPPVDEYNRPLYGDVFGIHAKEEAALELTVNRTKWGQLDDAMEEDVSSSSESEEETEEDSTSRGGAEKSGTETPLSMEGYSSMQSGLETPDFIDLRKRAGQDTPDVGGTRELYQVIQEKHISGSGHMFGSDKAYALPGKGEVQVSINPEDLDHIGKSDTIQEAYESQARTGDRSDLDETDKDPRKKRKSRVESGAVSKRHKDFKF
jgi:splicing factor 3B subunit 2